MTISKTSNMIRYGLIGLSCFYLGVLIGMSQTTNNNCPPCRSSNTITTKASILSNENNNNNNCPPCPKGISVPAMFSKCPQCPTCTNQKDETTTTSDTTKTTLSSSTTSPFPKSIQNLIWSYATVPREELNDLLDIGIPLDESKTGSEHAVVFYQSPKSMPTSTTTPLSAQQATENCQVVKVILLQPSEIHSKSFISKCFAILPQWESYHVHKFMRLPKDKEMKAIAALKRKHLLKGAIVVEEKPKGPLPLRYVSRSHTEKGTYTDVPSFRLHTQPFYKALTDYLQQLPITTAKLQIVLEQTIQQRSSQQQQLDKTVIVQVCNYGQVELFHNFVCNAKARGLWSTETQQQQQQQQPPILLFATDQETYDLCQSLQVPGCFYDETIFGDMPTNAARGYGDKTFSKMMMAKVYCVHLVLSCGYNVLFQDVDVIWYQNPLPWLHKYAHDHDWDLLFQDDGARSLRYAPYSPNTGFYYVRYSEETLFFFGMLLRSGDTIAKQASHQAALNALLTEHVSWKGLRVKVFPKGETTPFPGGFEYHRAKPVMKKLLTSNQSPVHGSQQQQPPQTYIFHMSWTKNKDNKKKFFQQMGEWYLKDNCLTGYDCCLEKPNVICHYRDKPSIVSCKNSPPIDAGRPSWW